MASNGNSHSDPSRLNSKFEQMQMNGDIKSTAKPLEIAIIGGGQGGLCLAICLQQHNVPFHIYEAAPSFGEIGAGIMCGAHAVNALRLISPDLLEALKNSMTTNANTDDPLRWGAYCLGTELDTDETTENHSLKLGDTYWKVYPDEVAKQWLKAAHLPGSMSSFNRAQLLATMIKLVPKEAASFGKHFERLEQLPSDRGVRMHFSDGTTADAAAVIGCDGIKSRVRTSIMSEIGKVVEPTYCNEYAYRSLIPMDRAKELIGEYRATNCHVYDGIGGYMVTYPVAKGDMMNVTAVLEDKGRPGVQTYDKLVTPATREFMYEDWKAWAPQVQALLREFKTSDQWSLWDLPHDEKYYLGRVCLLGDAAHAAVPHLGSGAGMAMEDAFILGNLIAKIKDSKQLEDVFAAYDAVRRPRTQKLVQKSREAGKFHSFSVFKDMESRKAYAKDSYVWVWGFDIEKQLDEAMALAKL